MFLNYFESPNPLNDRSSRGSEAPPVVTGEEGKDAAYKQNCPLGKKDWM